MTKLEEKLIELGYKNYGLGDYGYRYEKTFKDVRIIIDYFKLLGKINNCHIIYKNVAIKTQQDIDNLQQAFNQLQNDLDVLKEYEKKETKSV